MSCTQRLGQMSGRRLTGLSVRGTVACVAVRGGRTEHKVAEKRTEPGLKVLKETAA